MGGLPGAMVTGSISERAAGAAFLFPGQGSQSVGMGADLVSRFEVARRTFEESDEALGFSLSRLCFEGPESDLTLTANTQPAILTVSVALTRVLDSLGLRPSFAAGHSLGEYSALVGAGVLPFRDAVRAVRLRGQAMQEAVPSGEGAMAAILGLPPEAVSEACARAAGDEVVSPANFNSPEQTVIAGHAAAVARASQECLAAGAMRAVPLTVSAPFHCSLMRPAERGLAEHLSAIRFSDPEIPVVVNADAAPVRTGEEARDALVRQVCSPVRWVESIQALRALGVDRVIEVGPGRVLTGLMRRIDRSLSSTSVEDSAGVDAAVASTGARPASESRKESA